MKKSISRIIGLIMLIIAIVFIMFALNHPEKSFPWNNTITWLLYGVYFFVIVVLLIAPKMKKWEISVYWKVAENEKSEFGGTYDEKMIMALCIFICAFTLVACSGQQTNESLTLGVNAIITEIDKENKIITTKDSGEEGVLGDDCLIDCSQIPMIYCNYDTQDVVDITLDDLQVGDEIILTIRSSEIENLQKEDDNKAKIAVEQLQLGTQRIK